ncbi:hypothetical protein [Clostridium sardiniense]|uniref:hypothetical protein n=1 Tax=Clostridium sardiniense TaxID=29369 RepID=UPI00195B59E0|nr:hypothetical protein [Clostridium sardiniense]MBM7834994.1 hypothetical protein [Clostridium sardiniense]
MKEQNEFNNLIKKEIDSSLNKTTEITINNIKQDKVMERDQYENINNKINLHYSECLKNKLEEMKDKLISIESTFKELETIKFYESVITQYLYDVLEARENKYGVIRNLNIDIGIMVDYKKLLKRIDDMLSKFNM